MSTCETDVLLIIFDYADLLTKMTLSSITKVFHEVSLKFWQNLYVKCKTFRFFYYHCYEFFFDNSTASPYFYENEKLAARCIAACEIENFVNWATYCKLEIGFDTKASTEIWYFGDALRYKLKKNRCYNNIMDFLSGINKIRTERNNICPCPKVLLRLPIKVLELFGSSFENINLFDFCGLEELYIDRLPPATIFDLPKLKKIKIKSKIITQTEISSLFKYDVKISLKTPCFEAPYYEIIRNLVYEQ